jgi:prepilin-type N-terminal cleavage/methylation domain-containing protein
MQLNRGFTLVELAVVVFIVALLLGGVILTLSAQEEQRANAETRRRLEAAVDALIGFAIVNRRLPCPAVLATGGVESPVGGGTCTANFLPAGAATPGFLPGRTIGFLPVDAQGFAVDAWGNRIRYAVANNVVAATCSAGAPHFTSQANLKANGAGCQPNDLVVCQSSGGAAPTASPPSCNTAPSVTNQQTVAFVVLSPGKNGGVIAAGQGADELFNMNGSAVFISREHGTRETTTGSYDDLLIWVPAGVLYSRLLAAGVLP